MKEEMVVTTLDKILTKDQLKQVKKVIEQNEKKKIKPSDMEYSNSLKELFKKWHDQLLEKGVLPDFLAYWMTYTISKNPMKFKENLNLAIRKYGKVV
jgi:hypothetical protein